MISESGVIYIQADSGKILGIVDHQRIITEDGTLFQATPLEVLEAYNFTLEYDFAAEAQYLVLTDGNQVKFTDSSVTFLAAQGESK